MTSSLSASLNRGLADSVAGRVSTFNNVDDLIADLNELDPTASEAIAAVVGTEGDLDLAAERLFGPTEPGTPSNKTRLIKIIAEDPTAQGDLQRILKTLTLLQAFSTFKNVALVVDGTLDRMDANQRGRFMNALLLSISSLADDHTQTVNTNATRLNLSLTEAVTKSLPPDIQQALKVLQLEPSNSDSATWSLGDAPPNAAVSAPEG